MSYVSDFIEENGLATKNGVIVTSAGRQKDVSTMYKKYKKELPAGEMLLDVKNLKRAIIEQANDMTPEKPTFQIPSVDTEAQLVKICLKALNITISPTGEEIIKDTNPIAYASLESLVAKFLVDYNNQSQFLSESGKMIKIRRTFVDGDVKKVIEGQIVESDIENRHKLKQELAFKGEKHADYVKAKLKEILSKMRPDGIKAIDYDVDFHVLMIMQWMWQVKQHLYPKMNGSDFEKTVKDYYFINFSSPSGQGAGKTTFVRKLTECLNDYSYDATLQNAASASDHGMFASNYIVFFDELSFGSIPAADRGKIITVFKWLLTAEKMFQRIFHKQKFQKMRRMFSGIGTSNGSLTDVIYDPTGMRRFYEITVSATRNEKRYKSINDMDSVQMWQGIDENDREGFIKTDTPEFKKLQAIQAGYIKRDAIDIYLDSLKEDDGGEQLVEVGKASTSKLMKKYEDISHNLKVSEVADELGISLETIQDFRNDLLSFYEDDGSEKRFLPKRESLARQLRNKGYWILKHNNADLVVMKSIDGEKPNLNQEID